MCTHICQSNCFGFDNLYNTAASGSATDMSKTCLVGSVQQTSINWHVQQTPIRLWSMVGQCSLQQRLSFLCCLNSSTVKAVFSLVFRGRYLKGPELGRLSHGDAWTWTWRALPAGAAPTCPPTDCQFLCFTDVSNYVH